MHLHINADGISSSKDKAPGNAHNLLKQMLYT